MKRIVAWILAALALCAGAAQAAEWADGLGPSMPYKDMPAVNLEEKLGYMMLYPRQGNAVENACDRLYIYLPREDVKAGDGTFYLLNEAEGLIWSTAMDDPEAVTQRALTEEELDGLLWGGGTCFEIGLPRSLELGKPYFVNMTAGCVVTQTGVTNPQIGGTDSWAFTVEGEYGVSALEYLRPAQGGEPVLRPATGDTIRFDLTLGGEAAIASLYDLTGAIDFLTTTMTESGEVVGEIAGDVQPGELIWGVVFLDGDNQVLRRVEFRK